MFENARLKLTFWYLLIIMLISVIFSVIIYNGASQEIRRIIHIQELRRAGMGPPEFFQPQIKVFIPSAADLEETENRLKLILILINTAILVFAGTAGYFLAGRTLLPIKKMLDEQNRFISDASHELRTPITAMRTETEVALRDKNLTLAQAKDILTSNLEEAIGIQELSNGLLNLTQAENLNGRTQLVKVSLKESAREAIKKITPIAKVKKINIKSEVADLFIKADKQNIVELFVILLDNAVKYSHEKGRVELKVFKKENKACINISDDGIGITKKDIPHIFDRFYRAEKSRSKLQADGFGLGLSIAKKIVEEHSGTISVKSEFGHGATFSVILPAHT